MISNPLINQPLLTETEIKKLMFSAPVTQQGNTNKLIQSSRMGDQVSSLTGAGSDFAEVRSYHAGDDIRHIDWRASARSSATLVRSYHSELNQPICFVVDRRYAMRFATRVRLKVTQALRVALWMGGKEARQGRDISVVILDYPDHWISAQQGLQNIHLMAKLANKACPIENSMENPIPPSIKSPVENHWHKIFSGLKHHNSKGCELIILSDFANLNERDNKNLRALGQHCITRAVQIIDPSEIALETESSLLLKYKEKYHQLSRRTLFSNKSDNPEHLSESLSQSLTAKLSVHNKKIAKQFRQSNVSFSQISVEEEELNSFDFAHE